MRSAARAAPAVPVPNRQIGEVAWEIDGRTYIVRPTFELLTQIEGSVGGYVAILQSLSPGGAWRASDVIRVVALCTGVSPEEAHAWSIRHGVLHLAGLVTEFLLSALSGEDDRAEEPAASEPAAPAEAPARPAPH